MDEYIVLVGEPENGLFTKYGELHPIAYNTLSGGVSDEGYYVIYIYDVWSGY